MFTPHPQHEPAIQIVDFSEEDMLRRIQYMAVRREYDHLLAQMLEAILPPFSYRRWGENSPYKRFFDRFQEIGVSIVPLEDDSPVPTLADLDFDAMQQGVTQDGLGIDGRQQIEALRTGLKQISDDDVAQCTDGAGLDPVDFAALVSVLASVRPRRVVQVSLSPMALHCSKLLQHNADSGYPAEHIILDRQPSIEWQDQLEQVSTVYEESLAESSLAAPESFGANDLLILDQCKTMAVGNDLFYVFNELLPQIKNNVLVHFHPVFLPFHYPEAWLTNELVFWNQQYVLAALLRHSARYSTVYSNYYLHREFAEDLSQMITTYDSQQHEPGSFWISVNNAQGDA